MLAPPSKEVTHCVQSSYVVQEGQISPVSLPTQEPVIADSQLGSLERGRRQVQVADSRHLLIAQMVSQLPLAVNPG